MKTLYEILEVSENASKEIIEKAYKVLAKKYHPDLQEEQNKEQAERQMKQINEAYSVLSDETKRKEYDSKLAQKRRQEQEQKIAEEVYKTQKNYQEQTYGQADYYQNNQTQMTEQEYQQVLKQQQEEARRRKRQEQEVQQEYERRYQQAYEGYLKSLGYKIKYKWTWKNYRDLLITICVIIVICTILWFFPPTNKLIMDFYNSNSIVKAIVDIIVKILQGIWNGICSVFSRKLNI